MLHRKIDIHPSWLEHLRPEFERPYMLALSDFLLTEKIAEKKIYPAEKNIFNSLNFTPLNQLRVVILGQDHYHGPNQAHGLSFPFPQAKRFRLR